MPDRTVRRAHRGGRPSADAAPRSWPAAHISPATASHHATALGNARLITTRREGKAALHTVTSLGLALLGQSPLI
ncbi:hypothetical protein [Streptomyces canus]|uniref:hypothetical protein n=1 Tax=Streptomyces canus TaxID=58343 RepID=UPI00225784C9|nr:hypothetical protein [Streptomyces canus]